MIYQTYTCHACKSRFTVAHEPDAPINDRTILCPTCAARREHATARASATYHCRECHMPVELSSAAPLPPPEMTDVVCYGCANRLGVANAVPIRR